MDVNEPVRVDINNIADWSRDWVNEQRKTRKFSDLFIVNTPWQRPWFEFRNGDGTLTGVMIEFESEIDSPITIFDSDEKGGWVNAGEIGEGDMYRAETYFKFGRRWDLVARSWYTVGEYGALVSGTMVSKGFGFLEGADERKLDILTGYVLSPVFLALTLCHCRNVELADRPITRQYRRLQERRGEPIIQYKTLVIEPFKKQVRNEARASGENEIERALHICRGHFATYTEEAPLFGKHVGTFWKPMHVRGNAKTGIVEKDYKVILEDEEGE